MILTFKLAGTPKEIHDLFLLRHDVFAEEKEYVDTCHDGLLYDYFDTLPGVFNLILNHGKRVIGGVRFVGDVGFAAPSSHLYDFKENLPSNRKLGYAGMFILDAEYRRSVALASTLANLVIVHASVSHFDYIVAPVSPMAYRLLERKGFEVLGDKFIDEETKLEVYPMALNLHQLPQAMKEFVLTQKSYAEKGNYERVLCLKNDVIGEQFLQANQLLHLVRGKITIENSKDVSSNDHFFNPQKTINKQDIDRILNQGGWIEAHSDCLFVLEAQ